MFARQPVPPLMLPREPPSLARLPVPSSRAIQVCAKEKSEIQLIFRPDSAVGGQLGRRSVEQERARYESTSGRRQIERKISFSPFDSSFLMSTATSDDELIAQWTQ